MAIEFIPNQYERMSQQTGVLGASFSPSHVWDLTNITLTGGKVTAIRNSWRDVPHILLCGILCFSILFSFNQFVLTWLPVRTLHYTSLLTTLTLSLGYILSPSPHPHLYRRCERIHTGDYASIDKVKRKLTMKAILPSKARLVMWITAIIAQKCITTNTLAHIIAVLDLNLKPFPIGNLVDKASFGFFHHDIKIFWYPISTFLCSHISNTRLHSIL